MDAAAAARAELVSALEVHIHSTRTKVDDATLSTFSAYVISVTCHNSHKRWTLEKRYSEFDELYTRLGSGTDPKFSFESPFPGKKLHVLVVWGALSAEIIERRRNQVEK
jgi:hypothetical protein